MKKTKLLTSIATLALVFSLGACEGDININVGDIDLGGSSSDTTGTESSEDDGSSTTTEGETSGDDGSGNTSEGGGDDTTSSGSGSGEVNALNNYTLSVAFYDANGAQTTIPEYASAYIIGDWDNWANFLPLTKQEDKTYEYTFSSIDVGSYEYKGLMWYSDEDVSWDVSPVEIITGTGTNGNATLEVLASEGDNYTKYTSATLTATLEEKGGDTSQGGGNPETELISNLIDTVNQLVEECDDEDGLSVWEAIHVEENDVEDDDYILTTRTYDLGTDEDVAFGVVDTYTSNDNYTTTRYYTGEGKYYEKTYGGYGSASETGIHSTSQGNTYASIADILGYYLEDYFGAIDDSGTLESCEYVYITDDIYYENCYCYTITDGSKQYCYYLDEDGKFLSFIYDNGEEAYEDGWEHVLFLETTEEAVNAKLDELDYETWPVSGVQLQFTFNLDGEAQTIPEGITLYYEENGTRTVIESSANRYVINPSSLEQGTHTYSIVLVADDVEETIASGTYDIAFDDSDKIKQLTINLTQAFEDYLGSEEDPYEAIINALNDIEPNFSYESEFGYESEYTDGEGSETAYDVLANSQNVGYALMSEEGSTIEYYSDGENTYSYDGFVAAKEEIFYTYEVYQGTAEQAFMWDIENIVADLEAAEAAGWVVDDSSVVSDSSLEVYIEGSTYDDFAMLYAYYNDDGAFSSFDYMYGDAEGASRYVSIQTYNVVIEEPDWLALVPSDEPAEPCEEHTWEYQDTGDGYHHTQVCSVCGETGETLVHQAADEGGACSLCTATGLNTSGVTYEKYEDGYKVSKLDATKEAIFVPAQHDGLSVICVGNPSTSASEANDAVCAQEENDGSTLKFVSLPDTVNAIGEYAFEKCYSLEEVNIPEGVTTMWLRSFEYCTSLKSITIPSTVTTWANTYVFRGCSSLESVTFLCEGCTQIGGYAFASCTSLEYIDIPEGVTTLGSYAFNGCSALTSIVLPTTLTTINNNCFTGCTFLQDVYYRGSTSVTATGTNIYYNNATKHYYDADGSLFSDNPDGSYWYYGEDGYPILWA